ncbi:hypothetical protein CLF_106856 [Clonorchis sinensis]|uniref:Uncharacterized protein n=1 Tax=Clonorchis sinensis TaxID=79923 RepID=G7YQ73_CLOSI|nr:hypothetical protein CLF_106856 [Clonorchis sinensis]
MTLKHVTVLSELKGLGSPSAKKNCLTETAAARFILPPLHLITTASDFWALSFIPALSSGNATVSSFSHIYLENIASISRTARLVTSWIQILSEADSGLEQRTPEFFTQPSSSSIHWMGECRGDVDPSQSSSGKGGNNQSSSHYALANMFMDMNSMWSLDWHLTLNDEKFVHMSLGADSANALSCMVRKEQKTSQGHHEGHKSVSEDDEMEGPAKREVIGFGGKHSSTEMVKFQPTVQQVGMNVSWSQLGSIGEFVVFAVNGTSGREGTVERRNGIVAGEWAGVYSSLGSGIHFRLAEETRWSEADMESQGSFGPFGDPVVVDHRPGGVGNSQPVPSNRVLPKFEAWEDGGGMKLIRHVQSSTDAIIKLFITRAPSFHISGFHKYDDLSRDNRVVLAMLPPVVLLSATLSLVAVDLFAELGNWLANVSSPYEETSSVRSWVGPTQLTVGWDPPNCALMMSPRMVTKRLRANCQARRTDQQPPDQQPINAQSIAA